MKPLVSQIALNSHQVVRLLTLSFLKHLRRMALSMALHQVQQIQHFDSLQIHWLFLLRSVQCTQLVSIHLRQLPVARRLQKPLLTQRWQRFGIHTVQHQIVIPKHSLVLLKRQQQLSVNLRSWLLSMVQKLSVLSRRTRLLTLPQLVLSLRTQKKQQPYYRVLQDASVLLFHVLTVSVRHALLL